MTREQYEADGWHIWGPIGETTRGLDGVERGGIWRAERRITDPSGWPAVQRQEGETLDELLGHLDRLYAEQTARAPRDEQPAPPEPELPEGVVWVGSGIWSG